MARKTKYLRDGWDEKLEVIEGWARDGLTDEQIAEKMGISHDTLYRYKKKYSEFSEALKRGKQVVDREVENVLLKRALGYEYDEVKRERITDPETGESQIVVTEVKTKEVKTDPTSIIFWLKNRKPGTWRDTKDINMNATTEDISDLSKEEREKRRRELRAKLGDD